MRKAIFIFFAIILVAVNIDWIHSCADLKSHKEVFGRHLTYADMYEYKDRDYDYVVRVPSFFNAQPDSLQEEKGRMSFEKLHLRIFLILLAEATIKTPARQTNDSCLSRWYSIGLA